MTWQTYKIWCGALTCNSYTPTFCQGFIYLMFKEYPVNSAIQTRSQTLECQDIASIKYQVVLSSS